MAKFGIDRTEGYFLNKGLGEAWMGKPNTDASDLEDFPIPGATWWTDDNAKSFFDNLGFCSATEAPYNKVSADPVLDQCDSILYFFAWII